MGGLLYITLLCDRVCRQIATCQWFSPGTPVSSINKTDRHDIAEMLLKVALNTITLIFRINAISRKSDDKIYAQ
jgi:hypothetical protein